MFCLLNCPQPPVAMVGTILDTTLTFDLPAYNGIIFMVSSYSIHSCSIQNKCNVMAVQNLFLYFFCKYLVFQTVRTFGPHNHQLIH